MTADSIRQQVASMRGPLVIYKEPYYMLPHIKARVKQSMYWNIVTSIHNAAVERSV